MFQLLSSILHESDNLGHMMDEPMMFWPSGFGNIWMWVLMMGYGLSVILITVWTYHDANKRDENATLWIIVVLFTMGIGVLAYILVRRPKTSPILITGKISSTERTTSFKGNMYCENCGNHLEIIDKFCDKCGTAA